MPHVLVIVHIINQKFYEESFGARQRKHTQQKPQQRQTYNDDKIKTANKASILNRKARSTKVGLKERESNRVSIADNNEWC